MGSESSPCAKRKAISLTRTMLHFHVMRSSECVNCVEGWIRIHVLITHVESPMWVFKKKVLNVDLNDNYIPQTLHVCHIYIYMP